MFWRKKLPAVFLAVILSFCVVIPAYAAGDRIFLDEEIVDDLDSNEYVWEKTDGVWYCTDAYGEPVSGWIRKDGHQYFFNKNGMMRTGWIKSQGRWYYLYTEEDAKDKTIEKSLIGTMARDTWIDNYYVDADGVQRKIKK